MDRKRSIHGIFAGRFQIVHKGHEVALQEINNRFEHICIGIFSPDSNSSVMNTWDYFEKKDNPFTYFQRVYLMDAVLRYNSIRAVIVPHWYPVPSLSQEFLPFIKSKREWFIPNLHGENEMRERLIREGEKISEWDPTGPIAMINSSNLRHLYSLREHDVLKNCIPDSVYSKTINFLDANQHGKQGLDEEFIVIPILGNVIHAQLICGGVQLATDYARRLIFSPIVQMTDNVQLETDTSNSQWQENHYFTFYQIHEIINEIMDSIRFYDYLVSPILVQNEKLVAIDEFLPDNRMWYWQDGVNNVLDDKLVQTIWRDVWTEEHVNAKLSKIRDDLYFSVCEKIHDSFNKRNFYEHLKSKKEAVMNNSVNGMSSSHLNSETEILNKIFTSDVIGLSDLIIEADALFSKKSVIEMQKIIEPVVKSTFKNYKEQSDFLDRIKRSPINIDTSFVAYVLVQNIKNNRLF